MSRRNLRTLSLNIFKDEGREAFVRLMESSDIFIEASKGPAFARCGISDEVLWERNKKLLIAHLSGFGRMAHRSTPTWPPITPSPRCSAAI